MEVDRIQRLCQKETQGLVFRLWDFTNLSLKDMHVNSGLFRAASGFMNCHPRFFYKYIITRVGLELCRKNITKETDNGIQQILENAPSKLFKFTENLRSCSWCDSQSSTDISIKKKLGKSLRCNRRHAFFFCQCRELSWV